MKKSNLFLIVFLFVSCLLCSAQSSDTVQVSISDLLRLQALLQNMSNQYESAMIQSSELQKIIDASETELNGLNLNLTLLRHELQNWKSISEAQASEINRLLPILTEQDKISKRQAELLGVTLTSNKRLKVILGVGIPAAALAGVIITWALTN